MICILHRTEWAYRRTDTSWSGYTNRWTDELIDLQSSCNSNCADN